MPLPRRRRVIAIVFASLIANVITPVRGQDSGQPWLVRVWKTSDGLAGNNVAGVVQTDDAFLWIVAGSELSRFDGVSFRRFAADDFAGGNGRRIRDFARLKDGGLAFVLTDGALVRTGKDGMEVLAEIPDAKSRIEFIFEDPDGSLIVVCGEDAIWRVGGGRVVRFADLPPGPRCRFATDLAGRVWFSKGQHVGLLRGDRFESLTRFPGSSNPRVAAARDGGVWIGAMGRLFRMDAGEPVEVGQLPQDTASRATTLLEDRTGAVWFGTYSSGLFRFEGGRCTSIPVSHRVIVSLTEDREGSIWVGTSGGGLNQIQPREITLEGDETGVPTEAVQALSEDSAGRLWGVTHNGLLVARAERAWKRALPQAIDLRGEVGCIAAAPDGALWIGTKSGLLHRWHNAQLKTWSRDEGLLSQGLRSLIATKTGDIWIGGSRPASVQRWRAGRLETFPLPDRMDGVRAMTMDPAGNVWVATAPRGLVRVSAEGEVSDESSRPDLNVQPIRVVNASDDGTIWLGYDQGGVGRIKGNHFARLTTQHGLLHDNIELVLPDGRGWLWLAAHQAVFKVREHDFADVAEKRAPRLDAVQYGHDLGLRPVFGETVGALRRKDGRLWIPTSTHLVIVSPEERPRDATPPPVFLTEMRVDEQVLASRRGALPVGDGLDLEQAALRLDADHRRIDIDFTALSFRSPANVRFRYRLDNFDDQWIDAGTRRSMSYSRLAAGDYRFRVKASNSDGVWNEVGAVLAFSVAPFFWETWWFRACVVVIFTAAVFGLARYITSRRLRLKLRAAEQEAAIERERARIARDIHDDLGSRLTRIVLLSGLAARERATPEKSDERVQEISETARQLIKSLDETVWAVNPSNDTLPHLIDYTGQFAVSFLRTAEIGCRLELPDHPPSLPISAEVRHNVFLTVKEALTNVVRHAAASNVGLRIAVLDATLEIEVTDDGKGFDHSLARETGADGLENMRERMAQIGGRFELESRPGAGTRITIIVPLAQKP